MASQGLQRTVSLVSIAFCQQSVVKTIYAIYDIYQLSFPIRANYSCSWTTTIKVIA